MRRVAVAGVLILLLGACDLLQPRATESPPAPDGSVLATTPDSIRDQVLARIEQYYIDFSRRDWARYAEHFWPGATVTTIWLPPGEPGARVVVTTVTAFVEQAPNGPGSKAIFEERLTRAEIRAAGNIAQVWANFRARFGDPGAIDEWTGVDAFTLLRHDDEWRIVALAYAHDPVPSDSTGIR